MPGLSGPFWGHLRIGGLPQGPRFQADSRRNCFEGQPPALRDSRTSLEEGHFQKRAVFWEMETETNPVRPCLLGKVSSTHV